MGCESMNFKAWLNGAEDAEILQKLLSYFTHDRSHIDNKLYRAGEFSRKLKRMEQLTTMLEKAESHMK